MSGGRDTLNAAIINEAGGTSGSVNGVWTNVATDGTQASATATATDHSDNWSSGGVSGSIGNRNRTDSSWTAWQQGAGTCGAGYRLFCFEQ